MSALAPGRSCSNATHQLGREYGRTTRNVEGHAPHGIRSHGLGRLKRVQLGQERELPEDGYLGEYLIDIAREIIAEHGDSYASLSESELAGKFKRTGGSYQVTYGGHPLYHFTGDTKPGQQNGQNKKLNGGHWYVVGKSGKFIKPGSGLVGGYCY